MVPKSSACSAEFCETFGGGYSTRTSSSHKEGGGAGEGVGLGGRGVGAENADFAEGAPCAEPPVYAVRVVRSSTKKLCTDPPNPPPPWGFGGVRREGGSFHLLKPIQHAARVGGP